MTIKMNRVWNLSKRNVRPLGLPPLRDKVLDGRLLTPAVLRIYGSQLVVLEEHTRELLHVGSLVTDRELARCRPRVNRVGTDDLNKEKRAELHGKLAGVPVVDKEKVEKPKAAKVEDTEPEVVVDAEEEELKTEEPKNPARKKRATRKKAAKEPAEEKEEAPVIDKNEEQTKTAEPEEGLTKLGVTQEDMEKQAAELAATVEKKELDNPFDL